MAINNWWESDPGERYWMEITDRQDVGRDLRAPQADASGAESWSYTLTSYVQPGDRVFHWHKTLAGEPAIVGWSDAEGPLEEFTMSWQARGTRGRARGLPTVGPAWRMPLRNFTRLDRPVTRTVINERRARILAVLEEMEVVSGKPLYAPFQNYGGRELRAQQGYLTKFPSAIVGILVGDEPLQDPPTTSRQAMRIGRSQGYQTDAAVRGALERHSVDLAIAHYRRAGATEIEEVGKPYDLRVLIGGTERHVEVKGSAGIGLESVQLTQGEVDHAHRWQPTDLFVVDSIQVKQEKRGSVTTQGGRARIWRDWTPDQRALRPSHLRYILPD